jgi:prepilin-type N-terminal cleavage/methylation domain-containing protein
VIFTFPRIQRSGFTLIELLAVVVIAALLLSAGLVALNRVSKASGVTTGAQRLENSLRLARQYAMAHRTTTRLFFIASECYTNSYRYWEPWFPGYAEYEDSLFRYVTWGVIETNTLWPGWQWLEPIQFLPAGTVFAAGYANTNGSIDVLACDYMWMTYLQRKTNTVAGFDFGSTNGYYLTIEVDGGGNIHGFQTRYIQFNPDGSSTRDSLVSVAEGYQNFAGRIATSVVTSVNFARIAVEGLTGRIRTERP